ncbi:stage II sporulation protein P [Paenibacillus abyssi]|uniref:Stage II sporulation protein P n=1 Tax=Paenibacillus abyssi TaxID=1340531 RepID=A0A917FWZ0_9BACL|nr:stage II sporulation protein P [Paenibacillus abyssi]GGG10916.1 stage II sporulation protein P [Paenibacillus abyssi]
MRRMADVLYGNGNSERLRQLLVTGRTFAILSICSMLFFVLLGLGGMAHKKTAASPVSSMKGFAAAVSSGLFADMLEMEIPAFEGRQTSSGSYYGVQTAAFLMRLLTDINPNDPRSLVAGELPGLRADEAFLLRSGSGTGTGTGPKDHPPLPITQAPEDEPGGKPNQDPPSDQNVLPAQPDDTISEPEPSDQDTGKAPAQATGDRKIAFIYHSHPRESWYPVAGNDPNSSEKNITLVGKRLAKKLEEEGVGALHSGIDYPTAIDGYRWELSYKYTMQTVKEAMAQSDDLQFFFDLHRDSQRRKHTTATIGGKDYAQVFFIIGHRNPDWKQNEKFATKIHEALEAKYPGISRGVWGKDAATGNGEYNQSLSPDSVLIEVGGVDNTLEESYRTADALAEVIAEMYWDAEKVDGRAVQQ